MDGNGHAVAVAALLEQLGRQVQALCFTKDLAPVQWSALRFLAKAGASARTVSSLATYSGVRLSSASRTAQLLLSKGLVTVQPHPDDNRFKQITLTEAGRDLLQRDPLEALAAAVDSLGGQDQLALRDLIKQVLLKLCPKPL